MRRILLDSSFILSCIKNKIDLFEQLYLEGYKILIPMQVLREINGLSKSNENAKLALKILQKSKFKRIKLQEKNTDNSIINYAKKNPEIIIATLDKEIKKKAKNSKLIIRGKKKLEII